MKQAGVARTEVVERQTAPQRLELPRNGLRMFKVLNQGTLGDLDHNPVERERNPCGCFANATGQRQIPQQMRRNVDGKPLRLPQHAGGGERFAHQHRRQFADQALLLRRCNERLGKHDTKAPMLPPGEDLDAGDFARMQVDNWLKEGNELVRTDSCSYLFAAHFHRRTLVSPRSVTVFACPGVLSKRHGHRPRPFPQRLFLLPRGGAV